MEHKRTRELLYLSCGGEIQAGKEQQRQGQGQGQGQGSFAGRGDARGLCAVSQSSCMSNSVNKHKPSHAPTSLNPIFAYNQAPLKVPTASGASEIRVLQRHSTPFKRPHLKATRSCLPSSHPAWTSCFERSPRCGPAINLQTTISYIHPRSPSINPPPPPSSSAPPMYLHQTFIPHIRPTLSIVAARN